jgi:N-acetylglutamate synthase-like GNAT family acetyltransferase
LVVAAEGRVVATAPLQVRPDVPECGWVRWVATDLDRRREGLARALVIGVLAMAGKQDVEKLVFRPLGAGRARSYS